MMFNSTMWIQVFSTDRKWSRARNLVHEMIPSLPRCRSCLSISVRGGLLCRSAEVYRKLGTKERMLLEFVRVHKMEGIQRLVIVRISEDQLARDSKRVDAFRDPVEKFALPIMEAFMPEERLQQATRAPHTSVAPPLWPLPRTVPASSFLAAGKRRARVSNPAAPLGCRSRLHPGRRSPRR